MIRNRKLLLIAILFCTLLITTGFKLINLNISINDYNVKSFHDFVVKDINGEDYKMSKLIGKKVIVVNTATECGLTPQLKILQNIYESLDTSKFEIIAFPANNFLEQEPGANHEIKDICQINYGVTFPIMSKVSVCNYIYHSYPADTLKSTKTTTDEIYQWLTQKSKNGVLDTKIKWNFQKFLIDENGKLIGTLSPTVSEEILTLKLWLCNNN